MHVYFKPIDLGWIVVRRDPYAKDRTDHTWPGWFCSGRGVDDPEVSQFMRIANELYVFPVMTPDEPRRDRKRMRLVESSARRRLVDLLADHQNWYQGGYTLLSVEPEPRNIGVLFRSGHGELVLFFAHSFTFPRGSSKAHSMGST